MKSKKRVSRSSTLHRQLPFVAHLLEVFSLLLVFAIGQNMWAVVVGANPDVTPPSVPTNVVMTGRSATSIDISWTASTDDVGVVGYKVFRGGTLIASPTTNSYSDIGLSPNTGYSYTVSAYDAVPNESAQSAPTVISTLSDTSPPSVPSNLHQTGQTTSTVTIAWNPSADNVATTSYEIYRSGSLVRTQAGTSYTDTGLAVYTAYGYNIIAKDAAGNTSNLSSTLYASTAQDITPPSVPDNLRKTSSTITSVSLAWNAATDDVGVSGYRVYRDGSLVGSPGGTSFTDSGLAVNSTHTYTVSAFDAAANQSAQSAPYSTNSSADTTPPTIPSNLRTTAVLDTSIAIAWDASTDDVAVTGYKIYRGGVLIGTASSTNFTNSGLTPDTSYSFTVVAYDAASNNSSPSAALPATTAHDTTPPSVPANLRSPSQTDSTIDLAWDAATDNNAVNGYDLYRGNSLITSTSGTTFTDTGRSVFTSYTYRVVARDASNNTSAQSSPFTVSTLHDTTKPTTPTNLTASNPSTTSIDLAWAAASDDIGVTGYNVYRDGVFVTTTAGTTYTNSALRYNTSYSFTVTAIDASANESLSSAPATLSTLPDTTAPSVTLTAPSAGNAQLTFPISANASDDLDLNRVEFYADSTKIATITTAPFAFNWDSYAVHNGSRIITAKAFDASGNFSSQSVTITVTNPPPIITSDLNGDHKVNIFDLSILLSHWHKSGAGDFNKNGIVDIFDLSVLLSQYGKDNSGYN